MKVLSGCVTEALAGDHPKHRAKVAFNEGFHCIMHQSFKRAKMTLEIRKHRRSANQNKTCRKPGRLASWLVVWMRKSHLDVKVLSGCESPVWMWKSHQQHRVTSGRWLGKMCNIYWPFSASVMNVLVWTTWWNGASKSGVVQSHHLTATRCKVCKTIAHRPLW